MKTYKDVIIENLREEIKGLKLQIPLKTYEVSFMDGRKIKFKAHGFNRYDGCANFWVHPFEGVAVVTNYDYIKEI